MPRRSSKASDSGSGPPGVGPPQGPATRSKVFISYSRKDKKFLERLLVHLKPLESAGLTEVWADTRLKLGDRWREEIRAALQAAKVAILLLSIDFLVSDFITTEELPPLLRAAREEGVLIAPIFVRPCQDRFGRIPSLNQFETENRPDSPLSAMKYDQREAFLDRLAGRIEDYLTGSI